MTMRILPNLCQHKVFYYHFIQNRRNDKIKNIINDSANLISLISSWCTELVNILGDEKNYFPISKSSNPRILQDPDNTV